MKKHKIPTILGILVLTIGIAAGVFLVGSRQIFRLGATPEDSPKNIRITNVSDSVFTISWTTDRQTKGFVQWGEKTTALNKVEIDEDDVTTFIHSLTLNSLTPLTTYYFKIYSNGNEFDNEGIPWQVKTGPVLETAPTSSVISGSVITSQGLAVANILVYVSVGGSSLLSTLTSEDGTYLVPISSARTQSLATYQTIDENSTLLEITVQAGPIGVASAQIYPAAARPVPPITIGQVHDFKSTPKVEQGEVPEASIAIPEASTPSSGFNLEEISEQVDETVSLDSIEEGDTLLSSGVDFFGEGPSGVTLSITIESEVITEQVTVDASGNWKLNLKDELEEGVHKITITWRDASGILRSLSRNFTVQAAGVEESPPTSTPTPSPSPSPTPTPNPTPTSTPTPIKEATRSATVDAGSLTPTFVLSIMGLGSAVTGVVLFTLSYKKGGGRLN